ncbi:hypothetical protein HMPREF1275_01575 [Propionibacterium sp. KPL1844]|nr:hypothetical protein HMPREF1275_01575 [Propionibacterium sp. KPL1844]
MKAKEAIDQYIRRKGYDHGDQPIRALVAFSGAVSDPDVPEKQWTEAEINGFSVSELPKKFHGDDYQVLVVAEKYQTGFDEPLLHTMYVDKKLAGVKAVQTLSRLNRTAPGKEDTFVLDTAQVLSESEVDAAVTALLSDDPARRGEVYRNLDFAKGRWMKLDGEDAEEFRAKLGHFCRAYSFLSQVMAFIDFVSDTWKEFRAEHE